MLTISKPLSATQAQTYHREEFQNASDNYYTEGEKIRGQWDGELAKRWGLAGDVDEQHFARLAQGQHPITGEQLVRHQVARDYIGAHGNAVHTMEHRAGWDATFSAPKGASITAYVGGDERIREAHRESVNVALGELQEYVQARISGNTPAVTTGAWVVAKFEHDSSRPVAGYAAPQMHTHVVVFNVTELPDGSTRALQPRELYRSQKYATAVYRSELAARLRELGYEVERGKSGQPEIKGYTQEYLDASSPRSREIRAQLAESGRSGAGSAQIAAHQTRGSKLDIPHQEMQRQHRELAAQHGHQPERVIREAQARVVQRIEPAAERRAAESAFSYARDKNLERTAVVDERELVRDALSRSMGEARLKEVQATLERRLAEGGLVEAKASIGRAFTVEEMIQLERNTVERMRAGQNRQDELASEKIRREVLREHTRLSESQRAAVEQVMKSRDQVMALEGVAGAGKTTSLVAVRQAAERQGYQTEGFAPTSRAAHKLEEAGLRSRTLQSHLARPAEERGGQHFYVVDESSLASTKQMNELFKGLREKDRVLLVGDVRQHQGVDAGRPYEQLQQAGMQTARLTEIVRQRDPELKAAVEQLSRGEVKEALAALERQGRVHEIPKREDRLQAIAREYVKEPKGTLVVSPDNQSRREINELIHRELQGAGQVEKREHSVRVLEPRAELTGADRAWAGQYQRGDVVRYSKGSEQLGIEKGEYVRVAAVDAKENRITVQRESGERVSYDPRRLQGVSVYHESERRFAQGERVQFTAPSKELRVSNRQLATVERIEASGELRLRLDSGRQLAMNAKQHPHLDYGYAMTSHSAQAQTTDRVLVHVETQKGEQLVNSRLAYVAVSRAQYDAQLYTNDKTGIARELGREVSHATALGEVAAPKAAQASSLAVPSPAPVVAVAKAVTGKVIEHVRSTAREIDQGRGIGD